MLKLLIKIANLFDKHDFYKFADLVDKIIEKICPTCGGSGKIREKWKDPYGNEHLYKRCKDCNGAGKVKETEKKEISIQEQRPVSNKFIDGLSGTDKEFIAGSDYKYFAIGELSQQIIEVWTSHDTLQEILQAVVQRIMFDGFDADNFIIIDKAYNIVINENEMKELYDFVISGSDADLSISDWLNAHPK